MINVAKPFLPPKEEYLKIIDQIWDRVWLTNNGPVLNELELRLKEYLDLDHLLFVTNGTIAMQFAIIAPELKGEIITTPFSYVATTSSIVWEGLKPIFVDISNEDFNINPNLIEEAITKKTSAILATHVFGNACKINAIAKIAKKHNLKVIYDAAHCFGTKYGGRSIFEFGDISTSSFHATKLFHTIEGGVVITKDPALLKKMAYFRNFGHDGPLKFATVGINGKNSEFHAAMGLANLKYIEGILAKRKSQWTLYKEILSRIQLQFLKINEDCDFNYAYFPVIFNSEEQLLKTEQALTDQYVFPRRYFNPSLNKLNYVSKQLCPVSESISSRVLTLPLFHDLNESTIEMICRIILRSLHY